MFKDEKGFGTIELVIILAILVGIALLFKTQITAFVENIIQDIVDKDFTSGALYVYFKI
ncbi:MAG: hypothetical protein JXR88_11450 [Clostridia bacterium]|nr:hypothetical protein [Clostridia bacterium]